MTVDNYPMGPKMETLGATSAVAVIPARMQSTRLPGKPLKDICGIPMIGHVVLRAALAERVDRVIVATDHRDIAELAEKFGATAVMTSPDHRNGTERVAEAALAASLESYEIVAQVNGDEALVSPGDIDVAIAALQEAPDAVASMLVQPLEEADVPSVFKVVLNRRNEVMYMSRADIPSGARNDPGARLKGVFVTCYRSAFLPEYVSIGPTPMELVEDNNELRVLEAGHKLVAREAQGAALSVDREQDLAEVRRRMPTDEWFLRYVEASASSS